MAIYAKGLLVLQNTVQNQTAILNNFTDGKSHTIYFKNFTCINFLSQFCWAKELEKENTFASVGW